MRRPSLGSLSRTALALTLAACTSRTTPAPTAPSPADALVPADAGLGAAPRKTGRHGGTAAGKTGRRGGTAARKNWAARRHGGREDGAAGRHGSRIEPVRSCRRFFWFLSEDFESARERTRCMV
jgi:hypothetical protein